ncbi:MAG: hypothetical protein IJW00_09170 [Clostridia bacterium]|nr:hypothetical protein [Clostridia bacterium]
MATDNVYLARLLACIEKKRRLSLREFGKTDLNGDLTPEEVNAWYDGLCTAVRACPPTGYVGGLVIHEDTEGKTMSVTYRDIRPKANKKKTDETVFVISTEINL